MAMLSLTSEINSRNVARSDVVTQVIASVDSLTALVDEWQGLHSSHGKYPFTDATLVETWWRLRGAESGDKLHIVTSRRNGALVAIAPLSITRIHGVRFLRWAGGDLFDYCDTLAISDNVNRDLWNSVREIGGYDVALLKAVHPDTSTHRVLSQFARQARTSMTHAILINDGPDAAWRNQGTRPVLRRKVRKLEARGPVRFDVVMNGPIPEAPFAALIRQKTAWAAQVGKVGLFDDPPSAERILRGMAESWASAGNLHFSWMQCGDHIIATHLGCVFRNKMYWYMPSYDVEWSDFSPGHYLLVKLTEWAETHGLEEFDFLRGGDAYKEKFANFSRELSDFTFPGSIIGHIAEPLLNSLVLSRSKAGH